MARVFAAGVRLLVNRLNSHQPHQAPYPLAVHFIALAPQLRHHPPGAVKWPFQIQLINPPHQRQIIRARRSLIVIERRARHFQQLALLHDREIRVQASNHRHTVDLAQRPDLSRKKSRSIMSCPTFSCRDATCALSEASARAAFWLPTNSVPTPSVTSFCNAWIWLACPPYRLASSAIVPSSRIAAIATFALNSSLCFFRMFVIFNPFVFHPFM